MKIDFNDPALKELVSELISALSSAKKRYALSPIERKIVEYIQKNICEVCIKAGVACIVISMSMAAVKSIKM